MKTLLSMSTFAVLLLLSGCTGEEMMPVQTVTAGSYQIEIHAPGGILKSGDNPITLHVTEGGQPVDVTEAELMFFMPQMGAMPYMEMHGQFSETTSEGTAGTINFSMGGSWNGEVRITTQAGPSKGTFQLHVEERQ